MRDLFQVVFDFKKKEIEKAKQQLEMQQKVKMVLYNNISCTRISWLS